MGELFINKTKCTKEEYDRFQESYKKEYALSEWISVLYYFVFFIFCIVMSFISKEFKLGIILIIAFCLYLFYKFIFMPKRIKKQEGSNQLVKEYVTTYIFYNKIFTSKNEDKEVSTPYFKIYRVIETKTNYYIYVSREYAFIVSKEGFENDKEAEFKEFIKKKVKLKYKQEK